MQPTDKNRLTASSGRPAATDFGKEPARMPLDRNRRPPTEPSAGMRLATGHKQEPSARRALSIGNGRRQIARRALSIGRGRRQIAKRMLSIRHGRGQIARRVLSIAQRQEPTVKTRRANGHGRGLLPTPRDIHSNEEYIVQREADDEPG